MKPTIEHISTKGATVIYQVSEENGVGEPALIIRQYNDGLIGIMQEDREVLINRETVEPLFKLIRQKINRKQ